MRDATSAPIVSLRVNPIACDGVGMCAHLTPQLITLDRWGFPLFTRQPLTVDEIEAARRAVRGCPERALLLDGE